MTCMSWFPHDTSVGRDDIELPADIRMLAVGYASGKVGCFLSLLSFFFWSSSLLCSCVRRWSVLMLSWLSLSPRLWYIGIIFQRRGAQYDGTHGRYLSGRSCREFLLF